MDIGLFRYNKSIDENLDGSSDTTGGKLQTANQKNLNMFTEINNLINLP